MKDDNEVTKRYTLVLVRPDGTRLRPGGFDSYQEAVTVFKAYDDPKLRARIEDRDEDREYWISFPDIQRQKSPAKPSPPSIVLTAWGETKNILAWARDARCKCSAQVIKTRIRRKTRIWTPEEAIATPPKTGLKIVELLQEKAIRYEAFGEEKSVPEWLADPRCQAHPLWFRKLLARGVPCELALIGVAPAGFRERERLLTAWNETKTLTEWSRDPRCRIGISSLSEALKRGLTPELAMRGQTRMIKSTGAVHQVRAKS